MVFTLKNFLTWNLKVSFWYAFDLCFTTPSFVNPIIASNGFLLAIKKPSNNSYEFFTSIFFSSILV